MALTSQVSSHSYSGNNSSSTPYNIPFPYNKQGDWIKVQIVSSSGAITELTKDVGYTVDTVNDQITTAAAYDSTNTVVVYREVPKTQERDLTEGTGFPQEEVEAGLDKLTMLAIDYQANLDFTLRASVGSTTSKLTPILITNQVSSFFGLDASGNLALLDSTAAYNILNLPSTIVDQPVATWADDAARALKVSTYIGQLGVQIDTGALYRSSALTAGSWTEYDFDDVQGFADAAARSAAIPGRVGQLGFQLDTNVLYYSTGTSAGNWSEYPVLKPANNLSDIGDAATARGNLGALSSAAGAVLTANIGDLQVTNAKLAGDIALSKMADQAAWSLTGRNSSSTGAPAKIALADLAEETGPDALDFLLGFLASGEMRKFDVGNIFGQLEKQSSQTASASTSLDFNNLGSGVHAFRFEGLKPTADSSLAVRTSDDNGSTFESGSSAYSYAYYQNRPDTEGTQAEDTTNSYGYFGSSIGAASDEGGCNGWMFVYDLASSSLNTIWMADIVYMHQDGYVRRNSGCGQRNAAKTLDALRFIMVGTTIASGSITHYKVRGL